MPMNQLTNQLEHLRLIQLQKIKEIYKTAKSGLVGFYRAIIAKEKYVKPAKFHYVISEILLNGKTHFAIQAFRESGKSSYVLQSFPLYCLLFPNVERQYIIIIKQNQRLAETKLKEISEMYLSHPLLKINLVKVKEKSVKVFDVTVKSGGIEYDIRFEAYGKGSSIRGLNWGTRRPQIVVCDDLQDVTDSESETIQENDWNWFLSDVKPLGKNTRIFMIGNNLGEKCLLQKIINNKQTLEFDSLVIPIIKEGIPTWKEKFNEEFIEKERKSYMETGKIDIWYRERMCMSMSDSTRVFKQSYFRYYEILPEFKTVLTAVDLAISQKETADYTAIVTIGITSMNEIYILDIIRERLLPDEVINKIFEGNDIWKPKRIGIEDVSFQKMLILEMRKQMKLRNKFFMLEGIKPMGEKESRIKSVLQPRYASMSIYHRKGMTELEEELLQFPKSEHDDVIDGLCMCIKMSDVDMLQESSYTYRGMREELSKSDFEEAFEGENNRILTYK